MNDLSGSTIDGKYELLRQIGHGGMGAVYEARSQSTRQRCAVKLLLAPERAGDADSVKRFIREARAGGLIESEHVLAAFDSGIDSAGHPYYVMDYLDGEDLEKTLDRVGTLSPIAASKVVLQAALGLAKAHELGIVHRDVKPANLFLVPGEDGEVTVKVLDFGIAKVRHEDFDESSAAVTRTGSMLGTPRYMSPEQIRRASKIDASADVWSLGIVLFECLCGRHPWDDTESLGTLMAAILTGDVPLIQDHAPWVQAELAEIVERAISRDPARRLRTAGEFRDALLALVPEGPRLMQTEITAPADAERMAVAPRKPRTDNVALETTQLQSSLPSSSQSVPAPPKSSPRSLLGVLAGIAAVAATALLLARGAPKAAPPASPARVASSGDKLPVESRRFLLEVLPAGVTVSVNGTPSTPFEGKVPIEGPLGSAYTVRLTRAGQTLETRVALTAEGLIPPKLELQTSSSRAPSDASSSGGGNSRATDSTSLQRSSGTRKSGRPAVPLQPASSAPLVGSASPSPAPSATPAMIRLDDKFD